MRGFICVLVCLVSWTAISHGQSTSQPSGGGQHTGHGHGHGHAPPNHPVNTQPNPNGPGRCRPLWTEYQGHCYLYESGAILPRTNHAGPFVVNAQEGMTQDAANLYCASQHQGATLVTLESLEENDFLYGWAVTSMIEPIPVWIGLHAHFNGTRYVWHWYDQTLPGNFTNWDQLQAPLPEAGLGAVLFDADLLGAIPANAIDISGKWRAVDALGPQAENFGLICEYSLTGSTGPLTPMLTDPPTTTTTTTTEAPTTQEVATTAATSTQSPGMLNNQPVNLMNLLSRGRFGGSQLHEVPRRPSSYRMNPYYAVMP